MVEKQKLPPPYASTVYELTPYGRELDEVLYALGRWGARSLGPPAFEEELYPEWGLNALPALFDPVAARGLTGTYVLKIGDDVFTAHVEDGHLEATVGRAEDADLVAEMDLDTFFSLAERRVAAGGGAGARPREDRGQPRRRWSSASARSTWRRAPQPPDAHPDGMRRSAHARERLAV